MYLIRTLTQQLIYRETYESKMQADKRDWKLHYWHKVLLKRNKGEIPRISSFVLAKFRTRQMIEFSYNLSKKRSKHRKQETEGTA